MSRPCSGHPVKPSPPVVFPVASANWPPAWCVCPDYPSIPYAVTRGFLAACQACKSAPCALCKVPA